MSSTTDSISAIVCTYDESRWEALGRAVASLRAQTRPLSELIVVVDHNPRLLERVRAHFAGVLAVENRGARGLSGSRNTAAATASGSLIAYLDDDASAAPDWIEQLAGAFEDPDVLGSGGRVLPRWLALRPEWFPEEFLWVVGCSYRGLPTSPQDVRNLYGGCFCLRRDVVEEVGGFRVELGRIGENRLGCEETEFCIRAARSRPGGIFRYNPAAIIEHDVPAERAQWSYFRSRCYGEGVSKARLTVLVGAGAGLSAERTYATRTLPAGVVREISAAIALRSPARMSRAGAITGGFLATAAGFAYERARGRMR